MLALSNEPHRLINMTLDTLAQVLGVECCWVQTVDATKRSLVLAAERGFNSEMRREMAGVDIDHSYSRQVVGLGNSIIIPDLSRDGRYQLGSFRTAGFRWLVAAPLMTYRIHGVLGIASRTKNRFRKETPDLAMVIAGLIGTALNKADLSHGSLSSPTPAPPPEESPQDVVPPREETAPAIDNVAVPPPPLAEKSEKPADSPFHQHISRMHAFRRRHH